MAQIWSPFDWNWYLNLQEQPDLPAGKTEPSSKVISFLSDVDKLVESLLLSVQANVETKTEMSSQLEREEETDGEESREEERQSEDSRQAEHLDNESASEKEHQGLKYNRVFGFWPKVSQIGPKFSDQMLLHFGAPPCTAI